MVGFLPIVQQTNSGNVRPVTVLSGPVDRLSLRFESRQYVVRVVLDDVIGDRAPVILAFGSGLDKYDAHEKSFLVFAPSSTLGLREPYSKAAHVEMHFVQVVPSAAWSS
jgi:hypothetical protein